MSVLKEPANQHVGWLLVSLVSNLCSVNSSLDPQEVIRDLAESAAEALEAKGASIEEAGGLLFT